MTYLSVDRRRLSYLLGYGTQEGELKRFFDESFKTLLHRKARLRNVPYGNAARIKTIVEVLPSATDDVLRGWFKRNLSVVDPIPADELIEFFRTRELGNDPVSSDEAPRLARSFLYHLFSDNIEEGLLSFLRSPVPGNSRQEIADLPKVDAVKEVPTNGIEPAILFNVLTAIFVDGHLDDALDQLPPELAHLVKGLDRARRGDDSGAREALALLRPESAEADTLARAMKHMRGASNPGERGSGLTLELPRAFSGDVHSAHTNVFGYCTTDRPGATFIKAIGVIQGGRLEVFTEAQRREFFPESGDAIFFSAPGKPQLPERGQVGVWDIEEHLTDKKVRCHIVREVREVYSVVRMPIHSSDADAVRTYIQVNAKEASVNRTHRLYETSDGLIIGPRNQRADLSREEVYEQTFESWNGLDGFPFEDRRLITGPLPHADGVYDCAPIAFTVKAAVKALHGQQKIQLTRAQIREIVGLFREQENVIGRQRLARIIEHVEAAEKADDALNEMVTYILGLPDFRRLVDDSVKLRVDERMQDKEHILHEIKNLKAEHSRAEERLRNIEEVARRKASETAGQVKAAFDKAISNGLDTLVSAQVFQALGNSKSTQDGGELRQQIGSHVRISKASALHRQDALGLLKVYGIDRRFAMLLATVADVAARAGVAVLIRGEFSRQVAVAVSRMQGEVVVVHIPVGLIEPPEILKNTMDECKGRLVLIDANLSDFDLYGQPVVEAILGRIMDQDGDGFPILFGSLMQNNLTLPMPIEMSRLSLLIDLKIGAEFELSHEPETIDLEDFTNVLAASTLHKSLGDRILDEVRNLPEGEQQGVLTMLRLCLTEA
jgi:hypothetical protein